MITTIHVHPLGAGSYNSVFCRIRNVLRCAVNADKRNKYYSRSCNIVRSAWMLSSGHPHDPEIPTAMSKGKSPHDQEPWVKRCGDTNIMCICVYIYIYICIHVLLYDIYIYICVLFPVARGNRTPQT